MFPVFRIVPMGCSIYISLTTPLTRGFNALLLVGVLPWVGVIMELCRQAIRALP